MRVHIVQKGDTLWKIAKQYAVGFEELKRLNAHLANPDYIVPGMEIYLPELATKKEVPAVIKEQPKVVPAPAKENPVQVTQPTPTPAPVLPQNPLWQGNVYFQPPMPQPMPNWQTHVHVQPSMEQHVAMPAQVMPQPQLQPIYMQAPQMMMPAPQQMMHPMPQMPQMTQVQPCPHCYKMPEEPMRMQPAIQEESSSKKMSCPEHEQQVRQYYEEIHQMMCMPNPCCQMMPYPYMHPMQRTWPM